MQCKCLAAAASSLNKIDKYIHALLVITQSEFHRYSCVFSPYFIGCCTVACRRLRRHDQTLACISVSVLRVCTSAHYHALRVSETFHQMLYSCMPATSTSGPNACMHKRHCLTCMYVCVMSSVYMHMCGHAMAHDARAQAAHHSYCNKCCSS